MLNMFFRFIGSLYLTLFPLKKPKLGNLLFTILQGSCLYSVVLGHYFPAYVKPLMIVGFIGLGFGRAGTFLPYILAYQNLKSDDDIVAVNLWISLVFLGFGLAYLINYLFSTICHYHWSVEISVSILIFIGLGIIVFIALN